MRAILVLTAVAALLAGTRVQVLRAESRWGGPPVEAWVAVADSPVGAVPELERVRLPPRAVPPRVAAPTGGPLAVALPEGAVLTELHLSATGPAVGLPPGERLVPIPVDEGWGVTAGARVDVWVQAADGRGPRRVGAARPVLDVRTDDAGRRTALVGMAGDEVAAVTSGIAGGGVLLSIVPDSDPSGTP